MTKNAVYITHGVRTNWQNRQITQDVSDTALSVIVIKIFLKKGRNWMLRNRPCDFWRSQTKIRFCKYCQSRSTAGGIGEGSRLYGKPAVCGSGLQAIIDAFEMIAIGEAGVIVAGGVENMSQSVYYMRNAKEGLRNGDFSIEDSLTAGGPGAVPVDKYGVWPMGMTAEKLAGLYHITRESRMLCHEQSA